MSVEQSVSCVGSVCVCYVCLSVGSCREGDDDEQTRVALLTLSHSRRHQNRARTNQPRSVAAMQSANVCVISGKEKKRDTELASN